MITAIIIIVICFYLLIYFIYQEYKEDYEEIEKRILKLEERHNKEVIELKKKNCINEQLIQWLYDNINSKMLKSNKTKTENKR